MRTEKEIKLERLTIDKAVKELMNECIKKWSKGQLDTSTIMELLSMPMIVFNTLNWVLGDTSGVEVKNVISGTENITRCLKANKPLPKADQAKWFAQLSQMKKEHPRLYKAISEDKRELLEIDWNSFESEDDI